MPSYEVRVMRGPKEGTVAQLPEGGQLTLGRAPANDLCLMDPAVSSFHARFNATAQGATLSDLKSRNGTFVNGQQLEGSRPVSEMDLIEMGSSELKLVTLSTDAPAPSAVQPVPAATAPPPAPPPVSSPPPRPAPRPVDSSPRITGRIVTPSGAVKVDENASSGPVFASIDTNKSMALDPKMLKSALAKFSKAEKNLATLHAVGAVLASVNEPQIFFSRLMDHIFNVVDADRGAIFLVRNGNLELQVQRSADGSAGEIVVSQTILRRAVNDGISVLTSDAAEDDRFKAGASIIMQQIRSAMCVPVRGREETFGAIYVDSKLAAGAFIDDDLELLTTIAVQAGIALENSLLTTEAAKAERMAAIGLVVSGLAHDIKNYMMALKGGDFILDAIVTSIPSPEAQEAWTTLKKTHKSISELVMDMLSYSKQRDPEWARPDCNQTMAEAAEICKERAAQAGVEIVMELDYATGPFFYDPKNISRCVMNMVGNAIDASPPNAGKKVTLFTKVEENPGGPLDWIVMGIKDEGSGIPVEARDKIFDLMFSTKGSKGTGLGLAMTRKIVEEHAGNISFDTELGQGTTFHIRLPRRTERPAAGTVTS